MKIVIGSMIFFTIVRCIMAVGLVLDVNKMLEVRKGKEK